MILSYINKYVTDNLTLRYLNPVFLCVFPDQKKAKGEELFEQIMYHLDIVEKDYFGLRFMDSAQVPVRMEKELFASLQCYSLPSLDKYM